MVNKNCLALITLFFILISPTTVSASELGNKIKDKVRVQIEQSQAQSQEQTQIVENNNTNNNENYNYINNESNPEINISNNSESVSEARTIRTVVRSNPKVIYTDTSYPVEELPKTGLPLAAWILGGLIPGGLGLRKLKDQKKFTESANSIWEQRQFIK